MLDSLHRNSNETFVNLFFQIFNYFNLSLQYTFIFRPLVLICVTILFNIDSGQNIIKNNFLVVNMIKIVNLILRSFNCIRHGSPSQHVKMIKLIIGLPPSCCSTNTLRFSCYVCFVCIIFQPYFIQTNF